MKKYIGPLILFLLVLALMSTGSLAIYTQQRELRGRLYTRVFLFAAKEKTTSYDLGLSGLALEPGGGEKELYRFELTNADSSFEVSDYLIKASISSAGMSQALAAMDGLVFRLYNLTDELSSPVATVTSGELSYDGLIFEAGISRTTLYKLTAQWQDKKNSAAQTALAASGIQYSIGLRVTAEGMD